MDLRIFQALVRDQQIQECIKLTNVFCFNQFDFVLFDVIVRLNIEKKQNDDNILINNQIGEIGRYGKRSD
jgi:hypothetical protein